MSGANQHQSRVFIEKVREIGADEDSSRAEELMGRLAKIAPEKGSSVLEGYLGPRKTRQPQRLAVFASYPIISFYARGPATPIWR